MKRTTILSLLLATTISGSSLWAQYAVHSLPSLTQEVLRSTDSQLPCVQITPPTQEQIEEESVLTNAYGLRSEYVIGIPQELALTPLNSGRKGYNDKGRFTWQVAIEGKGAKALQLYFSRFEMPKGGELFIISPETGEVKGAFGAHNNTEQKVLAIAPMRGERLIIHYEAPEGTEELPLLTLGNVSYCFRTMGEHPTDGMYNTSAEPWFKGVYPCAPNVVNYDNVEDIGRSLVLMVVRGRVVCSGALINNSRRDGTAYVLTASHCMNGSFKYPNNESYRNESARQTVFFFNFRSPIGNRLVRGIEEQSLSGAKIIAWDEKKDLCLLRITGLQPEEVDSRCGIPASYRPYFSGWNKGKHTPPYIGLHHPTASIARYNECKQNIRLAPFSAGVVTWDNVHWHVREWDKGTTAGGSSGSPLYDSQHRIIGALSGGISNCKNPINDYYYALSTCWDAVAARPGYRLQPFLDPDGVEGEYCDGFDPYAPLSPERLSNNLYSLFRDDIEETNNKMKGIAGVATRYFVNDNSQLLGITVVASPEKPFETTQLNVMLGDENAPKETIHTMTVKHPRFFSFVSTEGQLERTIGGLIEFFVPIDKDINIPKQSYLYLGFSSMQENEDLPLPIVRKKQSSKVGQMAWLKQTNNAEEWISSDSDLLPEEIRYKGSYWIDALIMPLEKGNYTSTEEGNIETVLLDKNLRITLPEVPSEEATIRVYSFEGFRLYASTTKSRISQIDLSSLSSNTPFIIVRTEYKGKKSVVKFSFMQEK